MPPKESKQVGSGDVVAFTSARRPYRVQLAKRASSASEDSSHTNCVRKPCQALRARLSQSIARFGTLEMGRHKMWQLDGCDMLDTTTVDFLEPPRLKYAWLARDVITSRWWSSLLVLAEENKFGGAKSTLHKVRIRQQGPHNGS